MVVPKETLANTSSLFDLSVYSNSQMSVKNIVIDIEIDTSRRLIALRPHQYFQTPHLPVIQSEFMLLPITLPGLIKLKSASHKN